MNIDRELREEIISAIIQYFRGRLDGGRKNIVCDCPFCDGKGKFGIRVAKDDGSKKQWMSNCFKCQKKFGGLENILEYIHREDLIPSDAKVEKVEMLFNVDEEDELDDSLEECELPPGYKRKFFDKYLNKRGFESDDYDYFPVGISDNFKFDGYIIIPIYDNGVVVGYVGRSKMSKKDIDKHNDAAKKTGEYKILRYRNSTDNDFVKLLYNYDAVIEDETETVILVEGVFDVISIVRELELYDNHRVVPVATFGKKISDVQIYKLQSKGVRNVVIMYDADAVETIKKTADKLSDYFDVIIADPIDPEKDAGDMSFWEFWDTFCYKMYTPRDYSLNKMQGKAK